MIISLKGSDRCATYIVGSLCKVGSDHCAKGWAGALYIQKNEKNHKNSTHTKIKFPIIFFLQWIFKIFLTGERGQEGIFEADFFKIILSMQ